MITHVSQSEFKQAFKDMDRADNFSSEGLEMLYDYLEDIGDGMGEEVELDVIAVCCDFSEDTFEDFLWNYGDWKDVDVLRADMSKNEGYDALEAFVREFAEDHDIPIVGMFFDAVVYQNV